MTDLQLFVKQAQELIKDEEYFSALTANISSHIYNNLPDISWAGFYLVNKQQLVLQCFCGLPACSVIPLQSGVCGRAATLKETIVVPNVHSFTGHIACDSRTNSEIVIPIVFLERVIGVLDVDSISFNRFDLDTEKALIQIAEAIVIAIERTDFLQRG